MERVYGGVSGAPLVKGQQQPPTSAAQYRSVQEWLESRRSGGMTNDMSGTTHWSQSSMMPAPPKTAYGTGGAPHMAAGAKLMKGFPASMQQGSFSATTTPRASFANQFMAKEAQAWKAPPTPNYSLSKPATPQFASGATYNFAKPHTPQTWQAPPTPNNYSLTKPATTQTGVATALHPPVPVPPPPAHPPVRSHSNQMAMASLRRDAESIGASAARIGAHNNARALTPSGLGGGGGPKQQQVQKQILRMGHGGPCAPGDLMDVSYVGWLDGADPSTAHGRFDEGQNFKFTLGVGEVIPGWDSALSGMLIGEVAKLRIPSSLAYGANGAPPKIPPHATLNFEVMINAARKTLPPSADHSSAAASLPVSSAATATFTPSEVFQGPRPGFVYKNGVAGIGYYRDGKEGASSSAMSASAAAAPAPPSSSPRTAISAEGSPRSAANRSVKFDPGLPLASSSGPTDPRKYHDRAVAEIMQRRMSGGGGPGQPMHQMHAGHSGHSHPTPVVSGQGDHMRRSFSYL